MNHLFCLGLGYSANRFISHITKHDDELWKFSGTHRAIGDINPTSKTRQYEFAGLKALPHDTTHLLISIPPTEEGDPSFSKFADSIKSLQHLKWIGYLSSTGVYGDSNGEWVDEQTEVKASNKFAQMRIDAESLWQKSHYSLGFPVVIYRLSGIYGPGRSVVEQALTNHLKMIDKPDQIFSRIHVDDISNALYRTCSGKFSGEIVNLSDDHPSNPREVIEFCCKLLKLEPPKPIKIEDANLSEMGKIFYSQSKRVSNAKLKKLMGTPLLYPTFKEGLIAILAETELLSA